MIGKSTFLFVQINEKSLQNFEFMMDNPDCKISKKVTLISLISICFFKKNNMKRLNNTWKLRKRVKSFNSIMILLVLLITSNNVTISQAFELNTPIDIPDPIFKKYLLDNFDTNNNGQICKVEADKVIYIELSGMKLESIKGIEAFVNLIWLEIGSCGLKEIDLSNNKKLESLICPGNNLESLELRNNTKLEFLCCSNSGLTSLDVSKNHKLIDLDCASNKLEFLDLSNNLNLEFLNCGRNILHELNLTNNSKIRSVLCWHNMIKKLVIGSNPNLIGLSCSFNAISELDLSNCPKLEHLSCRYNELTALDISNNHVLVSLSCDVNKIETLDVTNNRWLRYLECNYKNHLTCVQKNNNIPEYRIESDIPFCK